jgi:calmodulin
MIEELDPSSNGCVDFNGFLKLMKRKIGTEGPLKESDLCTEDLVTEAFGVLDKDNDGFISPAELMIVLRVFGYKDMTEKDAAAALKVRSMANPTTY